MYPNQHVAGRSLALAVGKLLFLAIAHFPTTYAFPILGSLQLRDQEHGNPSDDPGLWLYLSVAAALVISGGAFAGLTIALMGQDEVYLQVIKTSGEGAEKKHAEKVLNLLKRGKHWVLVTLLLSNVITNETLPIILDRSLGGGWPAVLGSTALIVIFGEVVPQSICVRYGLPIGAWMAPCVLVLMYIMSPVAWPIAKLLDRILGEDHGTIYKKAGLKTLVTLHKNLGQAGEQLNSDEVTIITAVLDLKEKSVGSIMIPMEDVFTMSADTVLDEKMMDLILSQGYSRIPIHSPDEPHNFVGMLLVKMLITYDPEDCKLVRDFALATLPETRAETSCLDIVNFFQEGKSHMVLVSEYPGEDHGALGVVTLEDVIEELIGEEIIDESDVFIDVHKAIRRMAPAPKSRVPKGQIVSEPPPTHGSLIDVSDNNMTNLEPTRSETLARSHSVADYGSPPQTTFYFRKHNTFDSTDSVDSPITMRGPTPEIREHLKHLGPSNLASRPRQTRYQAVKIKPGEVTSSDRQSSVSQSRPSEHLSAVPTRPQSQVRSAGKSSSDAVLAVQTYGTMGRTTQSPTAEMTEEISSHRGSPRHDRSRNLTTSKNEAAVVSRSPSTRSHRNRPSSANSGAQKTREPHHRHGPARSGSITEQIVDSNGIRKVILQTSSDATTDEDGGVGTSPGADQAQRTQALTSSSGNATPPANGGSGTHGEKKKRRRKRRWGAGSKSTDQGNRDETQHLLE
ncbi:DUF21 and CBS domain-containing protein [Histoplasma capsulatum var. duboisii H88]|uniref:DUF21 and CBS domain-containing protein n=1 Tax=Ajellomyces capsulatus (strain H88) TaxID=544711 RepID=F0UUA5_AJEC8|nr:DUF21 and CBS domain-containing protein [Histoplasma capsulatum var. duboisii H88]QSS57686.1 DUF21 and CBS domain-containing protein [Histoplasma capsulatum var. duboisii H88]